MNYYRRCKECPFYRDFTIDIVYCPDHGRKVTRYPVPSCDCGKLFRPYDFAGSITQTRYCINCGKKIFAEELAERCQEPIQY